MHIFLKVYKYSVSNEFTKNLTISQKPPLTSLVPISIMTTDGTCGLTKLILSVGGSYRQGNYRQWKR